MGMTWKNKRVEIRYGSFKYESDESWEERSAKVLPLRHSMCTVRAIRPLSRGLPLGGTSQNAIFEVTIRGQPRRLWMAASKAERQAWIRAITDAMSGKKRVEPSDQQQYLAFINSTCVDKKASRLFYHGYPDSNKA